jgi:hypothetical protein
MSPKAGRRTDVFARRSFLYCANPARIPREFRADQGWGADELPPAFIEVATCIAEAISPAT